MLGLLVLCCLLLCRYFAVIFSILFPMIDVWFCFIIKLFYHWLTQVIHLFTLLISITCLCSYCFTLRLLITLIAIIKAIYFNLINVNFFIFIYQVIMLILFLLLMYLVNIKNYFQKVFGSFLSMQILFYFILFKFLFIIQI